MTNPGDDLLGRTSEADALEQQTPLVEETETPTPRELATAEADEADLHEQAVAVPGSDEDDYDR